MTMADKVLEEWQFKMTITSFGSFYPKPSDPLPCNFLVLNKTR